MSSALGPKDHLHSADGNPPLDQPLESVVALEPKEQETQQEDTIIIPTNQERAWYRRKGLVLTLVSMAQLLDIISMNSVTITLPEIQADVGYASNQLQWVMSAYALAYGGFLLVGGRLGDQFGHKRVFIAGNLWFTLWSLIIGFTKTPILMSVGRAFQGMGAGFTIPSALALLTTNFPAGPERTMAIAVFGASGAVGSVVGVLLGGIFGSTIGWRWIFFITGLISLLLSILGLIVIPPVNVHGTKGEKIDFYGLFLFMIGIIGIIYYLSEGPSAGWASAEALAPFLVGLGCLVGFIFIERRISNPIMPLRIWMSRRFTSSVVFIMILSGSMNMMQYFASLVFQDVQGYTSMQTSLAFVTLGVGAILTIVVLTYVMKYVRTKIINLVCWVCLILTAVIFAQIQPDSSYWSVAFPSFIFFFLGLSPLWTTVQLAALSAAEKGDEGVVGAVFNVGIQVGGPFGLAIANVVVAAVNAPGATGDDLLPGYHAAAYTFAAFSGLGLILCVIFQPNQDPPVATAASIDGDQTEVVDVEAAESNIEAELKKENVEERSLDEKELQEEKAVESTAASTISVEQHLSEGSEK